MFNVSELVNDFDLCSNFTIQRKTGQFAIGGWTQSAPTNISAFGAVRNSTGKELEMIPEADRPKEALTFRTVFPLYVTNEQTGLMSDVLVFQGNHYRILLSKNYSEQGYWFAMAVRLEGN